MAIGYQLSTPLESGDFVFAKLLASDRLGEPFRYEFHLLSRLPQIDFDKLLGQSLALTVDQGEPSERHFGGLITRIEHAGRVRAYEHYVATVRPNLWLLKQAADCRIFQNMSVPDIIKQVLGDVGVVIEDKLIENYSPVEYCVQYRESHFDFVSRLMEQEGIYYFFIHSAGQHKMVLSDAGSCHEYIRGGKKLHFQRTGGGGRGLEHVWDFRPASSVTSGTTELTDYDFETPRAALQVRSQIRGSYDLEQGKVFDYPGKYVKTELGQRYSQVRIEALNADEKLCHGEGNASGLATGGLFTLTSFPRQVDNTDYLLVSTDIEIGAISLDDDDSERGRANQDASRKGFSAKFTAIPANVPFRSRRKTARPVVGGPHTAVVVGKANEEIWTDSYGRIKVQFHWDRLGKKDENSTCWLRVAQGWAGAQWGSVFIPRIGQEVIVQFLEGDPDRPLVTGSLYNADQMPPYGLPENMTQSGIKTRSSKSGTDENYNELRFEDKKDSEEIYIHAERDFNRVVENNDTLKVGFEKQTDGDQTIDIYNNRSVTLDQGNDRLQVKKGNRTVLIDEGNAELTIAEGTRTETIKGDDSLTVNTGNRAVEVSSGDHSIKVTAGKSEIEAAREILLKVGQSSIKITQDKIEITAMNVNISGTMGVKIDGGANFSASGVTSTLEGQAMTTVKGGLVKIN